MNSFLKIVHRHRIRILLFLILISSFLIRFYNSQTYFPFGFDQAQDMYFLQDIWASLRQGSFKDLPLRGLQGEFISYKSDFQEATKLGNPVYNGVFYYYFLLPFALVSSFHPYGVVFLLISLGTVSTYLIFFIGKEIFDEETGLLASFFFTISYFTAHFARLIWTPSPMPFFVLLSVFSIVKIRKGESGWWPVFAFCSSATSQLHNSGYFFTGFSILAALLLRLKLPRSFKLSLLTFFAFLLPALPTILVEFQSNFQLARAVGATLFYQLGGERDLSPVRVLKNIFLEFVKFATAPLGRITSFSFANLRDLISLAAVPAIFSILLLDINLTKINLNLKVNFIKKLSFKHIWKRKDFILWLFLVLFLPMPWLAQKYYYEGGGRFYSLIEGVPFILLFYSYFIVKLLRNWFLMPFSVFLIAWIIYVNINAINVSLRRGEVSIFYPAPHFAHLKDAVKKISSDSEGKFYTLNFFSKTDPRPGGILYVFSLEKVSFPERLNGEYLDIVVIIEEKYINLENKEADIIYTIVESDMARDEIIGDEDSLIGSFGILNLYKETRVP